MSLFERIHAHLRTYDTESNTIRGMNVSDRPNNSKFVGGESETVLYAKSRHLPCDRGAVPLSHYSMTVREFCLRMVASMCLGTAWTMQLPMVALAAALAASLAFLVA